VGDGTDCGTVVRFDDGGGIGRGARVVVGDELEGGTDSVVVAGSLMAWGIGEPCPKPEPRCVVKRRREKVDAKNERAAREITRKRDKGRCRIPDCGERASELHHIVARSQSKRRRWDTANLVWLCRDHHRLRHAGVIHISGNADEEIVITGDINALRFRP
jgi:HNH endonuclease